MLRPTVSLLMGNACNSATNRSISYVKYCKNYSNLANFRDDLLAVPSSDRSGIATHLTVCQNQYKIGMIGKRQDFESL